MKKLIKEILKIEKNNKIVDKPFITIKIRLNENTIVLKFLLVNITKSVVITNILDIFYDWYKICKVMCKLVGNPFHFF